MIVSSNLSEASINFIVEFVEVVCELTPPSFRQQRLEISN